MLAEQFDGALERVFGGVSSEQVVPVSEAPENRSWFVSCGGRRIVAKLPEVLGGLTAGPSLEYEILHLAAAAGITPEPLGFDRQAQILFVAEVDDCRELTRDDAGDADVLAQLADVLRRLHTIAAPTSLRRFDAAVFAAHYCAELNCAASRTIAAELRALQDRHAAVVHGNAICHNDLHGANILTGEQLWLVDFEYAAAAAPLVDIASFAAFNTLQIDAAMDFARQCLGDDLPFSAAQLRDVVRMHRLLAELWEIARSGNNASQ